MHVAMTVPQFIRHAQVPRCQCYAEHHADSYRIVHAAPVVPHCTHAPQHQHSNIRHMNTAQTLHYEYTPGV